MFENRETSEVCGSLWLPERLVKTCGHKTNMNATEESDIGVVPKKEPNKAGFIPNRWRRFRRKGRRPRGTSEKTACDLHAVAGENIERTRQNT
jgi:hypothetical protein